MLKEKLLEDLKQGEMFVEQKEREIKEKRANLKK